MSERPLQDVLSDAPPRRGVPGWIWGCGGGCLLLMVLVVGFTVFTFNQLQKAMGPDAAWPVIQSVMPYEEPHPEGLGAYVVDPSAMARKVGGWFGATEEDLAEVPNVQVFGFLREPENTNYLFTLWRDTSTPAPSIDGSGNSVEFELQGKTVRAYIQRPEANQEDVAGANVGIRTNSDALMLDLGPRTGGHLTLMVQGQGGAASAADVVAVLQPFDLWKTLTGPLESEVNPAPPAPPADTDESGR